jgi:hypothetical protein
LKTNDMALLKVADLAVLVRRKVQIGAQNRQKSAYFAQNEAELPGGMVRLGERPTIGCTSSRFSCFQRG